MRGTLSVDVYLHHSSTRNQIKVMILRGSSIIDHSKILLIKISVTFKIQVGLQRQNSKELYVTDYIQDA